MESPPTMGTGADYRALSQATVRTGSPLDLEFAMPSGTGGCGDMPAADAAAVRDIRTYEPDAPLNAFSTCCAVTVRSGAIGDIGMKGAARSVRGTPPLLVPVVLSNYIAARAVNHFGVLRGWVATMAPRSSRPLSPTADAHAGLASCPWEATTVLTMTDDGIEATIAAKDWTISARGDATEFTYSYVYQAASGYAGYPLLNVVELAILPPELIIERVDVSPSGQGTFFCAGFTRPLGSRPNSDFEYLSDVSGRASGPDHPH
jgi:hypothetical protein